MEGPLINSLFIHSQFTNLNYVQLFPLLHLLLENEVATVAVLARAHMTSLEMRVHMDCPGCESKIKKSLQKLEGVDDVDIDMETQKVTVTGSIEQEEVLKTVRRNGRNAELWPFPDNPQFEDYAHYYYYNPHQNHIRPTAIEYVPEPPSPKNNGYDQKYEYYNGYNQDYFQHPPHSSIINEEASVIFNDDNTSACVIM